MSTNNARAGRAAAAVLALVLAVGACSGGADEGSGDAAAPEGRATGSGAAAQLATTSSLGRVTGRLPAKRRQQVRRGVVRVVDGWLDAAYVAGSYPRARIGDAWPGFTDGARREARRDSWLTSNARISERVDTVTPTRRRVRVDVLAVRGRPVGATAHVDLAFRLAGQLERTDRVRGRVLLTPTRRGWAVFGYDVTRSTGGDRQAAQRQGSNQGAKQGAKQGTQQGTQQGKRKGGRR